ncbi:MAG: DUF4164 domain-containing protein [Rhizobiaceae bacterium]
MGSQDNKSQASNQQGGGFSEALAQLNSALDSLDSTVDASLESNKSVHSADEEVQRMADDRTKLARDLDTAEARAKRLADTNSEVSRRLVGAMEIVRGVLDKSKP